MYHDCKQRSNFNNRYASSVHNLFKPDEHVLVFYSRKRTIVKRDSLCSVSGTNKSCLRCIIFPFRSQTISPFPAVVLVKWSLITNLMSKNIVSIAFRRNGIVYAPASQKNNFIFPDLVNNNVKWTPGVTWLSHIIWFLTVPSIHLYHHWAFLSSYMTPGSGFTLLA